MTEWREKSSSYRRGARYPARSTRFVISSTSGRVHRADCLWAKHLRASPVRAISAEVAAKFIGCGHCLPYGAGPLRDGHDVP